jgi:hypothetical protein
MVNKKRNWNHPYGTPDSAKKIINILEQRKKEIMSPKVWWDHPKIRKSYSVSAYVKKWKNPLVPDYTI